MTEEICCTYNKGKIMKNEWENNDSDFLRALYSVYKKIRTILFPYLLVNLLKQRYISFLKSCKYMNKVISKYNNNGLNFLKILCI